MASVGIPTRRLEGREKVSGATRYTAASSETFNPMSSSAGSRCMARGRRTCASGPGPSFAPQPAQDDKLVSLISSRVNTR